MPSVDLLVETELSQSARARQLEAMFDVPPAEKCQLRWKGDFPYDADLWSLGLIVGPSGAGKSTIARQVFGEHVEFDWPGKSVIDDFSAEHSVAEISADCQAVGFNTIPAWLRPYRVLSTGERFRVDLARRLLELPDPIVCDEFTSVVDRQVAKIGAHAVQKYVRKHNRKFVAVSCHYDIIDWLQPDWVFEPATMAYARRSLQERPRIDGRIARVPHGAWRLFAPFHYLTAELHRSAKCFVLFAGDEPTSFAGMLHRPHPRVHDIVGCSRLVTLPDWQGLGLAMMLIDQMGAAYKAIGKRLHTYPAHPALIRSFDKSSRWVLQKRPGTFDAKEGRKSTINEGRGTTKQRPCAVFEYCGEVLEQRDAMRLIGG